MFMVKFSFLEKETRKMKNMTEESAALWGNREVNCPVNSRGKYEELSKLKQEKAKQ